MKPSLLKCSLTLTLSSYYAEHEGTILRNVSSELDTQASKNNHNTPNKAVMLLREVGTHTRARTPFSCNAWGNTSAPNGCAIPSSEMLERRIFTRLMHRVTVVKYGAQVRS